MPLDNPTELTRAAVLPSTPSRQEALRMLTELFLSLGQHEVASLLSCPSYVIQGWLAGRVKLWPRDKRIIWLTWSLVFKPANFRSLFDIATFGRYLPSCGVPVKKVRHIRAQDKPQAPEYGE